MRDNMLLVELAALDGIQIFELDGSCINNRVVDFFENLVANEFNILKSEAKMVVEISGFVKQLEQNCSDVVYKSVKSLYKSYIEALGFTAEDHCDGKGKEVNKRVLNKLKEIENMDNNMASIENDSRKTEISQFNTLGFSQNVFVKLTVAGESMVLESMIKDNENAPEDETFSFEEVYKAFKSKLNHMNTPYTRMTIAQLGFAFGKNIQDIERYVDGDIILTEDKLLEITGTTIDIMNISKDDYPKHGNGNVIIEI